MSTNAHSCYSQHRQNYHVYLGGSKAEGAPGTKEQSHLDRDGKGKINTEHAHRSILFDPAHRKEYSLNKNGLLRTFFAQKRTSQGDFVTRLTMDAITKKERIAKLEHEAREKEEVMLNQKSVHKNKVIDDSGLERLTQVIRMTALIHAEF